MQHALLEELQEVGRQNDPLHFENNYNKTIYEPALAECQKNRIAMPHRCEKRVLRHSWTSVGTINSSFSSSAKRS